MSEEAPADENNTKKLIAGRIDAFVVEERTGVQAFINTGLCHEMQYDRTSPIAHHNVYYAFQHTEEGKQLAEIISSVLSEMKADGTYAEIMWKGETKVTRINMLIQKPAIFKMWREWLRSKGGDSLEEMKNDTGNKLYIS